MHHTFQLDDSLLRSTRRRKRRTGAAWFILLIVMSLLTGCDLNQPPTTAQPAQPSPVPAPPAYPTMEPKHWLGGSDPRDLPAARCDI
jgi:hypothetical protein